MATIWFYNSTTGLVRSESDAWYNKPGDFVESGFGWHGPFKSEALAEAYYTQNKTKNPNWTAPTTSIGSGASNLVSKAAQAATGMSSQNLQSWFIRIGEIVLGIVLVAVGMAKLTGTTNLVANAVKAKI